ncbi:iron ABC transporter permease [Paenibacillus sp. FSL W8-0439]|uniref:FecCD family ABC transporter permease n=1 Tax=Paenibacillus sp. FSL W8-0439 TaxID=2921716 RepID=UPI0030F5CEA9
MRITLIQKKQTTVAITIFLVGALLLILGVMISIMYGTSGVSWRDGWQALFLFNSEVDIHILIHELRLPRVLGAMLVGACMAVSGAIMQGITRNPMADPSVLGLSQGAGLALCIAMVLSPLLNHFQLMLVSFLGAGLSILFVYVISIFSPGGMTSVKMILAGTVISYLFGSLSSGLAIYFEISKDMAFFYAGGLSMVRWPEVSLLLPIGLICLLITMFLSRSISILSLGEEIATNLGQRTFLTKLLAIALVALMTGVSVSVAGAIGFIGLVIPHIVRSLVGQDYRLIIPCSAMLGGVLLTYADLVARWVQFPYETPVGALTAVLGVPFFLYLARKQWRGM